MRYTIMMNLFKRLFLMSIGIIYSYLGLWALLFPENYTTAIGLVITNPLGLAEIRAVYGGINTLIGCSAFLCLFKTQYQKTLFQSLSFVIAGILLGRFVSVALGQAKGLLIWSFIIFECLYLLISLGYVKKS